jgi:hypothetical protein
VLKWGHIPPLIYYHIITYLSSTNFIWKIVSTEPCVSFWAFVQFDEKVTICYFFIYPPTHPNFRSENGKDFTLKGEVDSNEFASVSCKGIYESIASLFSADSVEVGVVHTVGVDDGVHCRLHSSISLRLGVPLISDFIIAYRYRFVKHFFKIFFCKFSCIYFTTLVC